MENVSNFFNNVGDRWERCQTSTKNKAAVVFCAFVAAYVVTALCTGSMSFPVHFGVSVGAGVAGGAAAFAVSAWKKRRDGEKEERKPLVQRYPDVVANQVEMACREEVQNN
jgi:hypothetical protein